MELIIKLKPSRSQILNKFNGNCAYCGVALNGKFQVDHVIPKEYFIDKVKFKRVPNFLTHLGESDVNHLDNLFPSCASCNNYKRSMDLETFRGELGKLVARLNSYSSIYRIAKRFGQIEETKADLRFHFEYYDGYK